MTNRHLAVVVTAVALAAAFVAHRLAAGTWAGNGWYAPPVVLWVLVNDKMGPRAGRRAALAVSGAAIVILAGVGGLAGVSDLHRRCGAVPPTALAAITAHLREPAEFLAPRQTVEPGGGYVSVGVEGAGIATWFVRLDRTVEPVDTVAGAISGASASLPGDRAAFASSRDCVRSELPGLGE
jgi:hypothetical protein